MKAFPETQSQNVRIPRFQMNLNANDERPNRNGTKPRFLLEMPFKKNQSGPTNSQISKSSTSMVVANCSSPFKKTKTFTSSSGDSCKGILLEAAQLIGQLEEKDKQKIKELVRLFG